MVARTTDLEESFGLILSDISRLARTEFDRRVRSFKVTRSQWLVLMYVARRPGCSQSELADLMQLQKITVSRHIERLLRSGWIERRDHTEDGRAYHLYLSRKAEPLIEKLIGVADDLRGEFMRGLNATRRDALMTDLLHIKTNLLRLDAKARHRSHEDN